MLLYDYINEHLSKGIIPSSHHLDIYVKEEVSNPEFNAIQASTWFEQLVQMAFINELPQDMEELFILSENEIFVKTAKEKIPLNFTYNKNEWQLCFEILALKHNTAWNYKHPFASFHIHHNGMHFRATLIHHSLTTKEGSKLFLRKINANALALSSFDLDDKTQDFVANLVRAKKNIIIAGSTGSGKTSFIGSLMQSIPHDEHVIILEDTQELPVHGSRSTRLLQTEQQSLKNYLSYAMRMSPDRLVLGEIRGQEITPFFLALNTGHSGVLTSLHASNAIEAIHRLSTLYCMFGETDINYFSAMQIFAKNIDYVIYMKDKKISEICEIFGSENGKVFYEVR